MTFRSVSDSWHIVAAAATTACVLVVLGAKAYSDRRTVTVPVRSIRKRLPGELKYWRTPPGDPLRCNDAVWGQLEEFFADHGYTFWHKSGAQTLEAPSYEMTATGFMHVEQHRAFTQEDGSIYNVLHYGPYINALTRAARDASGRDVVIRVMAVGSDGRRELEIYRKLATGPYSMVSMNHTLPLFGLVDLEDITFGIFPKAALPVTMAYDSWAKTSVGDVLDMIAQTLEGLVFLHGSRIAHRDMFKDNLVLQWMPESLGFGHPPASHPRVYIIDFEAAVEFARDVPEENQVCRGPPVGGSFPDTYGRPMPPEVASGKSYSPYKLDVWQVGVTFSNFKTTIPEIDAVLESMMDPNPTSRPSAYTALTALLQAIGAVPPSALDVVPKTTPMEHWHNSAEIAHAMAVVREATE